MTARLLSTARGVVEVAELGDKSAPAVVIIHGSPGSWRQAMTLGEDLAASSSVLLPSRPGYGRTPLSSGRSIEEQADLVAAMLDAAGAQRASVIGISGGGPASFAFARRHPARTESLVLLCAVAAHLLDVPTAMRLLVQVPGVARLGTALQKRRQLADLADEERLARRLTRDLTPEERALLAEDPSIRENLERFLRSHADAPLPHRGMVNDVRAFTAARREGVPPGPVSAPTLIVHGDADTVVPLDHAKAYERAIPGSRLEIVTGTGHVFLLTHRDRTTQLVAAHLDRARSS